MVKKDKIRKADQLALGGRLLIPVGKPGYQEFLVVDKD